MTNADDAASYQAWVKVQQVVESPLDRVGTFWKYVMSAYMYYRARLLVPGRAYDSDESGMLAIGGSAHVDLMDLDVVVGDMSDEAKGDAYDWTLGSSQEQVAEWRKMGRGGSGQSTVSRRRTRMVEEIASGSNA